MSMENRDGYIWWDGELIAWRDARLHVLSYTVQHGAGVFEGIRAYAGHRGTAVFRLDDHVRRLFDSAKILQIPMPYTVDQVKDAHLLAIQENGLNRCYMRTNAMYDGKAVGVSAQGNDVHLSVAAWEWDHYMDTGAHTRGIRVKTSSFNRIHVNSLLRKAKANGHYLNSMLAVHEAKMQGYDDALLLDTQGFVAECSTSNLFVIRDGKISTPERVTVLEGVTRDTVITLAKERGLSLQERRITRDEVYCADEVFITGTAVELTPVVELDNRAIGSGGRGPVTELLQTAFFDVVNGVDAKHLDWLTPLSASSR
jgi:branched-chain amino acid aminotransferase